MRISLFYLFWFSQTSRTSIYAVLIYFCLSIQICPPTKDEDFSEILNIQLPNMIAIKEVQHAFRKIQSLLKNTSEKVFGIRCLQQDIFVISMKY